MDRWQAGVVGGGAWSVRETWWCELVAVLVLAAALGGPWTQEALWACPCVCLWAGPCLCLWAGPSAAARRPPAPAAAAGSRVACG